MVIQGDSSSHFRWAIARIFSACFPTYKSQCRIGLSDFCLQKYELLSRFCISRVIWLQYLTNATNVTLDSDAHVWYTSRKKISLALISLRSQTGRQTDSFFRKRSTETVRKYKPMSVSYFPIRENTVMLHTLTGSHGFGESWPYVSASYGSLFM